MLSLCCSRTRETHDPHPSSAFALTQTNGYVDLCTTEPLEGEVDPRAPHQASKSGTLGGITLENPAFEDKHIYGMLGIMITMGLTKKDTMRKHWSLSVHDNYPLVRECMQRDMFELLYSRFVHCSDGNARKRELPNGEPNPEYDSKWHIR